jgi:hypothetical protein
MRIRVKRTGVEWEIDEKSPTGARVKEQPDDYEILDDTKSKKGKGLE